ncbi:MAG: SDR family NAD(P)-dependent oxidoreductase [Deltaproteobacteria bacterium]|nr:SDR family NAD(P)-dependent oxidoreductase [Deltaproteobacteria bacterium]
MTPMHVLVTGGAGFVGSHLVDALVAAGHRVRILDSLDPQVHPEGALPDYLNSAAEFIRGDVREREAVREALRDVDAVVHLAAAVGVGQSMYDVARYVDVNSLGGALLLDLLANEKHTVGRMLVASSMSCYGEGKYACDACGPIFPKLRPAAQLAARDWEMHCPACGKPARPVPTDEEKPLFPTSIYAITKRDHEEMFLSVGRAYGIKTTALRFFNIYGPRQALSNPYTGVAAIFSSRLLNGRPPLIFEDGRQSRDFIHVSDVVSAMQTALDADNVDGEVLNVGTGRALSVLELCGLLADKLGSGEKPEIENRFREGDIRHCYADVEKIRRLLGWSPRIGFEEGVGDLVGWVRTQLASDAVPRAKEELERRGLTK